MKFVDSCEVDVAAGKGGNGAVAFRREKFVPFGGPSGGDGGRGGDIIFAADEGLSTLLDLTYARTIRGESGEQGHGKDMYGRGGKDYVVRVPVGTQIRDRETGELLFDIDRPDSRVVVAKGGKGGRGNIHFATPYDRAPRRSEPGEAGEEKKLRLELKVMADIGLLGFPNVGKSTFIRAVSRARPKVADYPFTTLTPHLGVVRIGDEATMVIADIPGLIPGAAEGAGLGHRFLKHVERTRALLHLVTLDGGEERDPLKDYDALMTELERFDPELAKRPQIVAMSKADLPEVQEAFAAARPRFAGRGIALHLVSAATGEGVRELSIALYELAKGRHDVDDWARPATPSSTFDERTATPSVEPTTPESRPTSKSVATKARSAPRKTAGTTTKSNAPAKTKRSAKAKTSTPTKTKRSAKAKTSTPTKTKRSAKAKTSTPTKTKRSAKAKTSTPTKAKRSAKAKTSTPTKAKRSAKKKSKR